jgi:plastocyanin
MALSRRLALLAVVLIATGCGTAAPSGAPSFAPGTPADPREVIVVARDYAFDPPVVDLVPGETVTFQVVNGGLATHEAIVGDRRVQDAWEAAEAAVANAPPGPTPAVSVPPDVAGLRIVVGSGGRVDATWTVPEAAPTEAGGWFLACHIAGHFALGMVVPVRFVDRDGAPLPSG